MVRGVVLLHPEAELDVVLQRLVRPRDLLVRVQQRPHVVAGDLATGVRADVARRILLVEHVGARLGRARVTARDGAGTRVFLWAPMCYIFGPSYIVAVFPLVGSYLESSSRE